VSDKTKAQLIAELDGLKALYTRARTAAKEQAETIARQQRVIHDLADTIKGMIGEGRALTDPDVQAIGLEAIAAAGDDAKRGE